MTTDCSCSTGTYPVHASLAETAIPAHVPYIEGCLNPTRPSTVERIDTELFVSLYKSTAASVNATRVLTMRLGGSDPTSPPLSWEVNSTLPPWLTLNSAELVAPNPIALPSVVGIRLAQDWAISISATLSPDGLAERTEPYETELRLRVVGQESGTLQMRTGVVIKADPVAARSRWGRLAIGDSECSRIDNRGFTSAGFELALGSEEELAFQTCDLEGLAARHSLPTQQDTRTFTATLIDTSPAARRLAASSADLTLVYTGEGAYVVKVKTPRLGRFHVELRLDGTLVDHAVPVHAVCRAGLYRDADGACQPCSNFANAPVCTADGVTLETLNLSRNTWRPAYNSSNIMLCKRSKGCAGGTGRISHDYFGAPIRVSSSTDGYCDRGFTGPLCSACQLGFFMSAARECKECGNMVVSIVITVVAVLVGAVIVFAAIRYQKRIRLFFFAGTLFRRIVSMARFKIIVTTYQIISSTAWGLPDVVWPEPFASLNSLLQVLNFIVVGTSCFSDKYDFYVQLIMVTTFPIAVCALLWLGCYCYIWLVIGRKAAPAEERRKMAEVVKRQTTWGFILITYICMPSTSITIIRTLRCDTGFGEQQNEAYLYADYTLRCYTEVSPGRIEYEPRHLAMMTYAIVMLCVYPLGINLMYLVMLLRNREAISRPKVAVEKAMASRAADPGVKHLTFIFKYYKPSAYLYEIVESCRRLLLGGMYVFFKESDDAVNSFVAFLIAFVFYMILRESTPFVEASNNTLAAVAQICIVLVFLGGFLLSSRPFDFDPDIWGWLLCLLAAFIIVAMLWYQYRYGNAALELELKLMEHEFRDAELALSLAEARNDVDGLRNATKSLRMQAAGGRPAHLLGGYADRGAGVSKAARAPAAEEADGPPHAAAQLSRLQADVEAVRAGQPPMAAVAMKRSLSDSIVRRTRISASILGSLVRPRKLSRHECRYPCYVLSLKKLEELDALEPHEKLLHAGKLEELTRTSRTPSGAFTFFISQNWESKSSPDNSQATKLRWLKKLRAHLSIPPNIDVWIWWDFISIPQKERSLQLRAIASLPYYANICSRFIPLVRDPDDWFQLYPDKDHTLPDGSLEKYLTRGWVRDRRLTRPRALPPPFPSPQTPKAHRPPPPPSRPPVPPRDRGGPLPEALRQLGRVAAGAAQHALPLPPRPGRPGHRPADHGVRPARPEGRRVPQRGRPRGDRARAAQDRARVHRVRRVRRHQLGHDDGRALAARVAQGARPRGEGGERLEGGGVGEDQSREGVGAGGRQERPVDTHRVEHRAGAPGGRGRAAVAAAPKTPTADRMAAQPGPGGRQRRRRRVDTGRDRVEHPAGTPGG